MNPNQLALANKAALEATGAFVVESDGRVRMADNRGGGYAPPWVWAGAIPQASGNDPTSQALRIKLSTPASDPSSPWHDMYQEGGPFSHASEWDTSKGTYEGGTDWGTLLGTLAVGGLFAGPAVAGAFGGGGGGAAAAGAGADLGPSTAANLAATQASLAVPESIAAPSTGFLGSAGGFLKTLAQNYAKSQIPGQGGGASNPLTDISQIIGGIERNRASGLLAQTNAQQGQDRLALERARLALSAPGIEASNAARGDLLSGGQDVTFNNLPSYIHVPTMSGGLRPSLFTPQTRQLGKQMTANALAANTSGSDVPALTPLPESSGLDSFLQVAGPATGFLGVLSKAGMFNQAPTGRGAYQGAGTPGYPGDSVSGVNNPLGGVSATTSAGEVPEDEQLYQKWLQSVNSGG